MQLFDRMRIWLYLAIALTPVLASQTTIPKDKSLATSNKSPKQYIIEMDDFNGLPGKRALSGSPHDNVYNDMRKRGISFDIQTSYNVSKILVGAAVNIKSADDLVKLAQTPGITSIRPVNKIPRPKPVKHFTVTDATDSRLPADPESTHKMTGVDKLHAEGNFGKGINIGIIDSGIDYDHPLLGGAFGPGNKVVGGYDFVGDAFTGADDSIPVPDNDPLDQCDGHGTHVAGIIGASGENPFGISGVASEASLSSYRILGCTGATTDKAVIDALLRAYHDDMDIITLSIGGANGWTEGASAVVASRIAAMGKVVTISTGNDGLFGSWYGSSPANGIDVIAAASVDNIVTPALVRNITVEGVQHDPIPYLVKLSPFLIAGTLPIYATSTNTSILNDACDPLPDSTPDLSPYLVVVRRGDCIFTQKLGNIAAKGAKVSVIYNTEDGEFDAIDTGNYTSGFISADDGKFLVNEFASKANITVGFVQGGETETSSDTGGLMSNFSSYGPTYDMYFKPTIAAPGGNILSTFPIPLGSYAVDSGTSMSAPFVAGAAALVLKAKGKIPEIAHAIRDLFQSTASNIPSSKKEGDLLQTVSQQGTGLIQVDRAIHTTTVVSPGQLFLNDTAHFDAIQEFSITNTGSSAVTYQLQHVPAGTALTIKENSIMAVDGPVPLIDAPAQVSFTTSKVTVAPGKTAKVTATFIPPDNVDASRLPVYSGFITITSPEETLKVSYIGVVAALKDKTIIDQTDEYFGFPVPFISNGTNNTLPTDEVVFTMQGDDVPVLVYRLVFGSPMVLVDLVDKDFKVGTDLRKRDGLSWMWGETSGIKTLGVITEDDYVTRNSDEIGGLETGFNTVLFNGTLANGDKVENGDYRMLLRALKVTGDLRSTLTTRLR